MKKSKYIISSLLILCSFSTLASAEDKIESGAFGTSKVIKVVPVKPIQTSDKGDKTSSGDKKISDGDKVIPGDKVSEGDKVATHECLSFEATYSGALDRKPSAFLDIEKNFTNLLNAFLQVTKVEGSDNKYRMALTASTAADCPKITDGSHLTISTYSGEDAGNSLQTTPTSITFTSKNNKLTQ